MSQTAYRNKDKVSCACALYPDKTLFSLVFFIKRILIRHSLFFLHANNSPLTIGTIVLSPEGHAFSGMFLKPFKKLAACVLSGVKTLGYASCF